VSNKNVQSVAEQILDSLHGSVVQGDKSILVRLNPPELGYVAVRLEEDSGRITGVLEVSREQTRHEIEQTLPEVARSLHEAGIQVTRLDVLASNETGRDGTRDQWQQETMAQQQESGGQEDRSQGPESPRARYSAGGEAATGTTGDGNIESPLDGISSGRINLLM
jgi:flagellar hook-length control protein FliK